MSGWVSGKMGGGCVVRLVDGCLLNEWKVFGKMSRWVFYKMRNEKWLDGCLVNGWRFCGKSAWLSSNMGGGCVVR